MLPVDQALLEGTAQGGAGPGVLGGGGVSTGQRVINKQHARQLLLLYLDAVGQRAELSPAVLLQPLRLLLGPGVLRPGQGERGGEEEARLQAPV